MLLYLLLGLCAEYTPLLLKRCLVGCIQIYTTNTGNEGTATGFFMLMRTLGPQLSRIISGYAALLSWRRVFRVALVIAGGGMPVVLLLPETYGPVLVN